MDDWQKKQRSLFPAESDPHPSPWQLRHLVYSDTQNKRKTNDLREKRDISKKKKNIGKRIESGAKTNVNGVEQEQEGGRGEPLFFLSTYPSLAVALLAEEAPGTTTSVTCFDGGRVRHLEHLHFAAEEIRRIGWDVPRARGGTATRTINFATAVRHKSPRRLPLLRKRLDFVLEHNNNNTKLLILKWFKFPANFFKSRFIFYVKSGRGQDFADGHVTGS